MSRVVLLGPQRFRPTVAPALDSLGVHGCVAAVTAGWQEREAEDDEFREHIGREVKNLGLYARSMEIQAEDPELDQAMRERQDSLMRLQELYRLRLDPQLQAARTLMAHEAGNEYLDEHRRAAIRAIRTLDRQHVQRVRKVHAEFEERWRPSERHSVARHREELAELIRGTEALAVAGGHVMVLLNRLRLFDLLALLGDRPVVAWSAGAMSLAERVVLFHDSPPQGAGNPEVLDAGLGAFRNLVALPHAQDRLQLDQPVRVALFARRFSPAASAVLEPGARLDWNGERWRAQKGTLRLARSGRLIGMGTH
ncbi:MAG: hypothetical protein GY716_21630 [bacterium]|nr:hypothetical protein [bacterium]